MVTDAELIKKYDEYYAKDKSKWAIEERDRLAFETIVEYVPEPKEILDVGMGNGHTIYYFSKRLPHTKFYGIDLSTVAVELAQKKVPDAQLEVAFLTEYKTRKKFDVIICLGTAEHFRELEENLACMKSLLRKDGICYVEIPNNLAYDKGEHIFRQLRGGSRQYEWHLPKEAWEKLFTQTGFEIIKFYKRDKAQWEFTWILR